MGAEASKLHILREDEECYRDRVDESSSSEQEEENIVPKKLISKCVECKVWFVPSDDSSYECHDCIQKHLNKKTEVGNQLGRRCDEDEQDNTLTNSKGKRKRPRMEDETSGKKKCVKEKQEEGRKKTHKTVPISYTSNSIVQPDARRLDPTTFTNEDTTSLIMSTCSDTPMPSEHSEDEEERFHLVKCNKNKVDNFEEVSNHNVEWPVFFEGDTLSTFLEERRIGYELSILNGTTPYLFCAHCCEIFKKMAAHRHLEKHSIFNGLVYNKDDQNLTVFMSVSSFFCGCSFATPDLAEMGEHLVRHLDFFTEETTLTITHFGSFFDLKFDLCDVPDSIGNVAVPYFKCLPSRLSLIKLISDISKGGGESFNPENSLPPPVTLQNQSQSPETPQQKKLNEVQQHARNTFAIYGEVDVNSIPIDLPVLELIRVALKHALKQNWEVVESINLDLKKDLRSHKSTRNYVGGKDLRLQHMMCYEFTSHYGDAIFNNDPSKLRNNENKILFIQEDSTYDKVMNCAINKMKEVLLKFYDLVRENNATVSRQTATINIGNMDQITEVAIPIVPHSSLPSPNSSTSLSVTSNRVRTSTNHPPTDTSQEVSERARHEQTIQRSNVLSERLVTASKNSSLEGESETCRPEQIEQRPNVQLEKVVSTSQNSSHYSENNFPTPTSLLLTSNPISTKNSPSMIHTSQGVSNTFSRSEQINHISEGADASSQNSTYQSTTSVQRLTNANVNFHASNTSQEVGIFQQSSTDFIAEQNMAHTSILSQLLTSQQMQQSDPLPSVSHNSSQFSNRERLARNDFLFFADIEESVLHFAAFPYIHLVNYYTKELRGKELRELYKVLKNNSTFHQNVVPKYDRMLAKRMLRHAIVYNFANIIFGLEQSRSSIEGEGQPYMMMSNILRMLLHKYKTENTILDELSLFFPTQTLD